MMKVQVKMNSCKCVTDVETWHLIPVQFHTDDADDSASLSISAIRTDKKVDSTSGSYLTGTYGQFINADGSYTYVANQELQMFCVVRMIILLHII